MAKKQLKTAQQWIDTIQDPTVKRYLKENHEKSTFHAKKDKYESCAEFIEHDFEWSETPQGDDFWQGIYNHFLSGEGTKTYEDFKHLDKSLPRTN